MAHHGYTQQVRYAALACIADVPPTEQVDTMSTIQELQSLGESSIGATPTASPPVFSTPAASRGDSGGTVARDRARVDHFAGGEGDAAFYSDRDGATVRSEPRSEEAVGAVANTLARVNRSQDAMLSVMHKIGDRMAGKDVENSRFDDKYNALVGIKLDKSIPKFPDKDLNFDRHWRKFRSTMALHALGRKDLRPFDLLVA